MSCSFHGELLEITYNRKSDMSCFYHGELLEITYGRKSDMSCSFHGELLEITYAIPLIKPTIALKNTSLKIH